MRKVKVKNKETCDLGSQKVSCFLLKGKVRSRMEEGAYKLLFKRSMEAVGGAAGEELRWAKFICRGSWEELQVV